MSQQDIYNFLVKERAVGNDDFWTVRDLMKKFPDGDKGQINTKVNRLYAFGFLDIYIPKGKGTVYYRRSFRIKKKYVCQYISEINSFKSKKSEVSPNLSVL